MVRVWAVIGASNTGKTSTIRALTGVSRTEASWEVAYDGHEQGDPTYVHPAGLQEVGISPKAFIAAVKKAKVSYVIVALRERGARGHPGFQDYLDRFREAGWEIAGTEILTSKTGRPALPSNAIAHRLRAEWGIV